MAGTLQTATGEPRTGVVVLVASLYNAQTDTLSLWSEAQTVTLDQTGRYSILVGSSLEGGVPREYFLNGSGLWLGVAVQGETEQPRVMLISVPYAVRAADADSVGGKTLADLGISEGFGASLKSALQTPEIKSALKPEGTAVNIVASVDRVIKYDGTGNGTASQLSEVSTGPNDATLSYPGVLRLNTFGRVTGGFVDGLNMGTWDMFGYPAVGRDLAVGGYRANQWDGIRFYTGGSERFRVDLSGNVGIGTAAPAAKLDVNGNINVTGNINAKYQDVAEWVETSTPLEPGTVVVVDSAAPNRVLASAKAYDTRVAGAVSKQPGLILGEAGDTKAMIAQSGRVRIKVDARYGAIRVGDLLVTSPTPGYAMRSRPVTVGGVMVHRAGTLLGKALEALPKGKGEILVLLTLQ